MPLVNAYGRSLKTGSPELKEQSAWRGTSYPEYPSRGLTPEGLSAIFMEADRGDVGRQSELYSEMEEKDAHLGAVLSTRKLAVGGLNWDIAPAGSKAEDTEVAAFVRDSLRGILNFNDALMDLLDAIGKGFSVSEIIWEIKGKDAQVSELRHWPQKAFTFANSDGTLSRAPKLLAESDPLWGTDLLTGKFILHKGHGRSGDISRAGVLRPCAWMYLFKHYTLKDWLIFCERYAQPMRIGKFAPGTSDAERRVLKDAVFNMGVDSAAVISDSTVIELLDSGQKGTAEIYEALASYCDNAVSKAVLGQTLTTEHSSGTYAAAKVHDSVRRDLIVSDARALAATLKADLITPLVRYNFGPDTQVPLMIFEQKAGEDLKTVAETLKTLKEMGVEIPASYIRERFGIPAEAATINSEVAR
jgi:phage gp29-like protein